MRPPQEIPLSEVAAVGPQQSEGRPVLDARTDDLESQFTRQPDRGADDGRVVLVHGHVGDVGPVDLEHIRRQSPEVGERRLTGAEIVDGHVDPQVTDRDLLEGVAAQDVEIAETGRPRRGR